MGAGRGEAVDSEQSKKWGSSRRQPIPPKSAIFAINDASHHISQKSGNMDEPVTSLLLLATK